MQKLFRIGVCFCLILFFGAFFVGCEGGDSGKKNYKAIIDGVNYESLTAAVKGAKTGDTIKIYDDLPDHKNVVINKPLSIKGIVSSQQVKPKFFGSLTVDIRDEDGSLKVDDLEIVHDGKAEDGENNDTRIGINLIDGGIEMKSCRIRLDEASTPDEDASGMLIARRNNSRCTMPIIVDGNEFGSYKTNKKDLSGALIIKRGGDFQKIGLNEGEVYEKNTFEHGEEGNQFISIDLAGKDMVYPYFVTSSSDEMIGALLDCQADNGSVFTLITLSPLTLKIDDPVTVEPQTSLSVEGNDSASLSGMTLIIKGSIHVKSGLEDVKLKKEGNDASIILDKDADKSKIEII